MRGFEAAEEFKMKVLCHFENIDRKLLLLRATIEGLRRQVCLLEADIVVTEIFDHQADSAGIQHSITTQATRARLQNLVRTILVLQGKLNEFELVQFISSTSQHDNYGNRYTE